MPPSSIYSPNDYNACTQQCLPPLDRERVKGNEAYRTGENDEAYACYSRSLAYEDRSPVVYANRAMVSLRTEKFQSAEDDCTRAISLDSQYVKAWSRRGSAKLRQGKYAEVRIWLY